MAKAKCPQEIDGGLRSDEPQIHLGGDLLTCRVKSMLNALAQDGQASHRKAKLDFILSLSKCLVRRASPGVGRLAQTNTGQR